MSYEGGGGQPLWEEQPYAQSGYGQQQDPQDWPWQPAQYDPYAHQQRIQNPPPDPRWQEPAYPQHDYPPHGPWEESPRQVHEWYQPPPSHRKRARGLLSASIAALVVLAGGGAAYALAGHSNNPGPSAATTKPATGKQQFGAWRTGPAKNLAESFKTDGKALQSASNSEDIPQMDTALKKVGDDAEQLEQYPMPACADPAGDWTQILAGIKAAGDNASSTPGLAGMVAAIPGSSAGVAAGTLPGAGAGALPGAGAPARPAHDEWTDASVASGWVVRTRSAHAA